jgi:general secretion pathway protein M
MRTLNLRERKLVAVLILLALIGLCYLLIVAPIVSGFATRAELREQLALRYAHNQRNIAGIPRLRRQAERQRGAISAFVVEARSAEAGRERIKERLQSAIGRTGGELREARDAEGRPGWARVGVSARLTLPQLTRLLAELQNQPPYLVIESLTVGADDALVTGQSSLMDVELDVSIPLRPTSAR